MAKQSFTTMDFTLSDETLNRYGYRVLTEGIDLSKFEANPTCYYNHDTSRPPVGRWVKVWKENGKLKGTLKFDMGDPFAADLHRRYQDGFMSAVSISFMPIEKSEAKESLLAGQRYPTISKCELLEVSVVTIPANGNAVKLRQADGSEYQLGLLSDNNNNSNKKGNMEKEEKTVEQLLAENTALKKLNADNLIALHKQRGVVSEGETAPLSQLAVSDYASVKQMLEARPAPATDTGEQGKADPAETLATNLVELHFGRGAITEAEKAVYKLAAIHDYENTRKALEARKGVADIQGFVQDLSGNDKSHAVGKEDRSGWSYLDWYKKDMKGLHLMKKNDPKAYGKLESDFQAACINENLGEVNESSGE